MPVALGLQLAASVNSEHGNRTDWLETREKNRRSLKDRHRKTVVCSFSIDHQTDPLRQFTVDGNGLVMTTSRQSICVAMVTNVCRHDNETVGSWISAKSPSSRTGRRQRYIRDLNFDLDTVRHLNHHRLLDRVNTPLPFPLLRFFFSFLLLFPLIAFSWPLPLELSSLKYRYNSVGERCKLSQRGLGQSSSLVTSAFRRRV